MVEDEMNALVLEEKQHFKNEKGAKAKGDLVAVEADMQQQSAKKDEEKALDKEAQKADAYNDMKIKDAISCIIADNTSDFKDFLFPTSKMCILFNRMHHKISNRIKELGADTMELDDAKDIITIYRSCHSKADDIKFLTNSYGMLSLQSDHEVVPTGNVTAANATNANAVPMPGPSYDANIPEVHDVPSRGGLAKKDKPNNMRVNSARRVVRFVTPENMRECYADNRVYGAQASRAGIIIRSFMWASTGSIWQLEYAAIWEAETRTD